METKTTTIKITYLPPYNKHNHKKSYSFIKPKLLSTNIFERLRKIEETALPELAKPLAKPKPSARTILRKKSQKTGEAIHKSNCLSEKGKLVYGLS